jgi:lipopolysaccharide export system protein LptA
MSPARASAKAIGRAVFLLAWLIATPLWAQGLSGLQGGDEPLEINAEEGIEWHRGEQLYIARGDARATRGDLTVYGDTMTAHYQKSDDGTTQIDRIDVVGNVRIESPSETVYGDRGAYDVPNGVLVVVGEDLRLVGTDDVITARDSLEYWERKHLAVARGDADARRADKRIRAEVLTATFETGPDGKQTVTRIDAYGNVRISTATEFARGERGVYYVDREFATLRGDVSLTREDNQLNGEYAEVDLKTGVSRLLAAPPGETASTRVRGLIVPKRKPTGDDAS